MNSVNLIGNIGQDLELEDVGEHKKLAFSIGISRFMGKDKDPHTDWINVVAWNKTAEAIKKHFKKGSKIGVTGSLKFEKWDDRESGKPRTKLFVIVDQISFCEKKQDGGGEPGARNSFKTPAANSDFGNEDEIPF